MVMKKRQPNQSEDCRPTFPSSNLAAFMQLTALTFGVPSRHGSGQRIQHVCQFDTHR